jgi:hypothetical protein
VLVQNLKAQPIRPPILDGGTSPGMGIVHTLTAFLAHRIFSFHENIFSVFWKVGCL